MIQVMEIGNYEELYLNPFSPFMIFGTLVSEVIGEENKKGERLGIV